MICTVCLRQHAPELMKVQEAAEILRVSDQTIYRMCESGDLPHVTVGRSFRISAETIYEMLRPLTTRAAPEQRQPEASDASPPTHMRSVG